MNDVAREARVALKTVSRYVNGETNINPAMAERIRLAIAQLGYRRNLAAASIRPGQSSKLVGLIIEDLGNPVYSTLARAVEAEVARSGYLLTIASSSESGEQHDKIVDRLMELRIDGLIIVPPREQGRAWRDIAPPIPPTVFLDRPVDADGVDTLVAADAQGSEEAVAQLFHEGAHRVAFIGDSLSIYPIQQRYQGYLRAHTAQSREIDERFVVTDAHDSDEALASVRRLMAAGEIDAIFAANNRAAIGALLAFRELGRRLPLIGFDDFEAAALLNPAVSVVSQDFARMGTTAAGILLDRMSGGTDAYRTIVLPTRLVLRGSEKFDPAPR
jgi:LacI family transcriptional regulator